MNVLQGQAAVVTGASRGIGRAVALELARHGASVVINYKIRKDEAEAAVAEVEAIGGSAVACQADVGVEADVRDLFRDAAQRFGRIDILICNAGIVRDQLIGAMSLEDWDAVLATNLRSVFLCIREALPHMMAQRAGSIVTMSSISAERATR